VLKGSKEKLKYFRKQLNSTKKKSKGSNKKDYFSIKNNEKKRKKREVINAVNILKVA